MLRSFAWLSERRLACGAGLVLAGPMIHGVVDDPEAPEVFRELELAWRAVPSETRSCVLLAQLPLEDMDENAAIVNALQRHAAIVVQKSLREGFGLTVTEAMWKKRPVVASAVDGIRSQIDDKVEGFLLRDPSSVEETANAFGKLLADRELARRVGAAAHERVKRDFLSITALERWAQVVELLVTGAESTREIAAHI